ncbi:50S ribosomal protein L25/general stress protein Ctc [Leptolyngbya sp. FACHB-711]|jgi:large subunit ribosomal protein L25|uniref:50S ribosomal protein L25/general stress protein Ctc n=1 Tax=unclassified Leptolyngbya TaxID=2650499 RepID=UPI001682FA04|nr:50S ribosomal protein L25/general stress protein Ctc [Leptolyngbya sp. FACHB-711]MBD1850254.1 50S ribosomal protein L25/general stress protein Ctc [Cyanobacteria bacterium FACHB-502]MBD2024050.1 50S ribosomal protein L25/general stress protein Ctc [Leptolyngbya sp. FACHB-711]
MELTIECQKRPEGSKPNAMRREGQLPAVLYGHNGAESVSLVMDLKAAELLVKKASLNNTLITLNVTDLPWSGKALLREVQAHPWRGSLYHLSFFSVGQQEFLQVTVPLHFVGTAIGVKQEGGALDTVLNGLEISCAPGDIPETIEVDISDLHAGDTIHVNQLQLPESITVLGDPDRVVVKVLGRGGQVSDEVDQEG